ncbi:MAG: metal ABC transporter substrate-binding protein [Clostridiales bacterium]|nr:metal ABC transporter substrate-binding protein [Clostridiales bacterium]
MLRLTMKTKRLLCVLMALILAAVLCGCGEKDQAAKTQTEGRLNIVCSLFPLYDFTRAIAGERANVTLILPYGVDSHDYEPSVGDAFAISRADLFIYTDDELETWVKGISGSLEGVKTLRCAENIQLDALAQEWKSLENPHSEEEGHSHKYDAHIWLDLSLASQMCVNIREELLRLDRDGEKVYSENCEALVKQLNELDGSFAELFAAHPDAVLCFGGQFAYSHFIRHYGVKYLSAYDSCSEEDEPSLGQVIRVIDGMKQNGAKTVFTDEHSNGDVAKQISSETGAKIRVFHTLENISKAEAEESFVSIMTKNFNAVAEALGGN